jgi:glycosyltransferase involved in cell wall biosynthesis
MLQESSSVQVVGGAELQQIIVARGLVKRGYRVSMICLNFGQEDRQEIDGIVIHRAYRPAAGIPLLRFFWPRLTSIYSCLKRVDADIYYHRAASVLTGVMAAFCQRNGKKSVFAVAGDPFIRFARDKWIYEYGVRRVDRIVVQNAAQERSIRERFGRDSTLIPNCYETVVRPECLSQREVLWVSTIRQLKRPGLFLDVAEALPDVRFTMIGGRGVGEAALFDAVKLRAERMDNVNFLGFIPYSEVHQHFDNAMVFVNTSDAEGFPNTFLQSWIRGVPTVSFVDSGARVGGQPVGCIVDSEEEMISVIRRLVDHRSERLRLGEVARLYVSSNHTPGRVLDLYDDLLRSMLD